MISTSHDTILQEFLASLFIFSPNLLLTFHMPFLTVSFLLIPPLSSLSEQKRANHSPHLSTLRVLLAHKQTFLPVTNLIIIRNYRLVRQSVDSQMYQLESMTVSRLSAGPFHHLFALNFEKKTLDFLTTRVFSLDAIVKRCC